jgi:anionic cell wall polymer biosynthesis LytR-Cps2A-Psr (LCP) family protein
MRVSNIWKLPELMQEVAGSVDTNLTTAQLLDLAQVFSSIDRSRVEGYILPGTPQYLNGISYWMPQQDEMEELIDALSTGKCREKRMSLVADRSSDTV